MPSGQCTVPYLVPQITRQQGPSSSLPFFNALGLRCADSYYQIHIKMCKLACQNNGGLSVRFITSFERTMSIEHKPGLPSMLLWSGTRHVRIHTSIFSSFLVELWIILDFTSSLSIFSSNRLNHFLSTKTLLYEAWFCSKDFLASIQTFIFQVRIKLGLFSDSPSWLQVFVLSTLKSNMLCFIGMSSVRSPETSSYVLTHKTFRGP